MVRFIYSNKRTDKTYYVREMPLVQYSRSVVSDSLQPRESQHARPPCPSPSPGVHSDSTESVLPSSHLILSRPFLLLPPILPSISIFSSESTLWVIGSCKPAPQSECTTVLPLLRKNCLVLSLWKQSFLKILVLSLLLQTPITCVLGRAGSSPIGHWYAFLFLLFWEVFLVFFEVCVS